MFKHDSPPRFATTFLRATNEEFFRIPRIEFLLEHPDRKKLGTQNNGEIGKMVVNHKLELSDRFSLLVEDNRMAGDGIQKGDYVVIQHRSHYQDGEIVAVQLGRKIMLRRLFRNASRIRLECPPPAPQTIILDRDTPGFSVLGSVIQVIKEI